MVAAAATTAISDGPLYTAMSSCVMAKVAPAASIAGQISIIAREAGEGPDKPEGNQEIEWEQNHWRWCCVSARTSMPVTPWSAMRGMPIAPNATGAVLASSDRPAACSGRKPRLIRMAEQTATGVPKPEVPSKERAQREGDQQQLQAAVGRDAGQALLERDEVAGLAGEIVKIDDGKNDPADGKEAVACAIRGGSEGETHRHVEDDDGGEKSGGKSGERGDVRLEPQNRHGAEQHHDGQSGDERGEHPDARWDRSPAPNARRLGFVFKR